MIISERRDKGLAQYKVKDVPYPFTSREQYEKVRAPTWFGSRPRAEALLPPAPHRALVFLTHSLSIARSCCLLRVPRVASPRRSPRRADLLRTANPPGRLYPATDAAPTDWERLEHDKHCLQSYSPFPALPTNNVSTKGRCEYWTLEKRLPERKERKTACIKLE